MVDSAESPFALNESRKSGLNVARRTFPKSSKVALNEAPGWWRFRHRGRELRLTALSAASRSAVSCCTPTELMSSPRALRRHRQQRERANALAAAPAAFVVRLDTLGCARAAGGDLLERQADRVKVRGVVAEHADALGHNECDGGKATRRRSSGPGILLTTSTTPVMPCTRVRSASLAPDPVLDQDRVERAAQSLDVTLQVVRQGRGLRAAAPCSDTAAVQSRMPASPCSYRTFAARIASDPKIVARAALRCAGSGQPSTCNCPATSARPTKLP